MKQRLSFVWVDAAVGLVAQYCWSVRTKGGMTAGAADLPPPARGTRKPHSGRAQHRLRGSGDRLLGPHAHQAKRGTSVSASNN